MRPTAAPRNRFSAGLPWRSVSVCFRRLTWPEGGGTLALEQDMAAKTQLMMAVDGARAWFQVVGRGDLHCSDDLRLAIRRLREEGCRTFTFDLAACSHMDSTFIGVLASPLRPLAGGLAGLPRGAVRVNRAGEVLRQTLEEMGLAEFIEFDDEPADPGWTPAQHHPSSRSDLTEASLEAHETLMALNPEKNRARFQDVVAYLRQELDRNRAGPGSTAGPQPPA